MESIYGLSLACCQLPPRDHLGHTCGLAHETIELQVTMEDVKGKVMTGTLKLLHSAL